MNTKYLMMSSAIFMILIGLATTFIPQEISTALGMNAAGVTPVFLQLTGALYLGFAVMNWMAKAVLIGGIYSKPLAFGNSLHFLMGGLALIKNRALFFNITTLFWVVTILYIVFAVWFAYVAFTSPVKKKWM